MVSSYASTRTAGASLVGLLLVLAAGAGALLAAGIWAWGLGAGALVSLCTAYALPRFATSATGTAIPAWDLVRNEIERARRRNTSLVVTRFPLQRTVTDDPQGVADEAGLVLRGSDSVWVEGRSILILLADADRDSAQHGVDRVLERLDGFVTEGVAAAFPGDEVTLGGLYDRLYPKRRVRPLSARRAQTASVSAIAAEEQQATAS